MRYVLPAILALLLGGCATQAHYKAWEGHELDELIRAWGPTGRTAELSGGEVMYSYNPAAACRVNVVAGPDGVIKSVTTIDQDCSWPDAARRTPKP